MEKMFGDLLPLSVGAALSPLPIAALVLMLMSNKARVNSVLFLIGWIVGLAALVFVMSIIVGDTTNASGPGWIVRLIQGILGVALIFFACNQWKKRAKTGEIPKTPKWMSTIEFFSPMKSLGLGLLLATVNLKNTPIGMSVGVELSRYPKSEQPAGLMFYLVIASSTILVPVVSYLVVGNKLQKYFESLKTWLVDHNSAMMFVLFLILGVVMISKALKG
jgi:hypothetical protein